MAAVMRTERLAPEQGRLSRTDRASGTVRVMVIDDSLTVRTVFSRMIDRESDLAIVAQASSAEQGLGLLRSTPVDVILLDLEMPGMGGLDALPSIQAAAPRAEILVVSSLTADGAEATLAALKMGAADTMLKPRPGGFNDSYRADLLARIRALGGKSLVAARSELAPPVRPRAASVAATKLPRVVAIGASTGGIHALNQFLPRFPAEFDLPILVTQHLPESFMSVFACQMANAAGREAVIAGEGTLIRPGSVVIAPGNAHMIVRKRGTDLVTGLANHAVKSGCRPSVDPMFETLAEACDGHVAAVLLSGMGRDGTEGALKVASAGGAVYAQDEGSCAVWGMPRAVAERGIASAVCPPADLADKVVAAAAKQGLRPWL